MKRIIAPLLILIAFSLIVFGAIYSVGLPKDEEPTNLGATDSEYGTNIDKDQPESVLDRNKYEKADQPLTLETINNLEIANDQMTPEQLRKICIDYLKLSVSCQWVADSTYYLVEEKNAERHFTEGKLYGGIPYVNMASGNLYRFMEYYDTETGILDATGICAKPELFATACSGTAGWAWARVINSVEVSWTHSITASHGFIPVGPYKYDWDIDKLWEWGEDGKKVIFHDTKKICKNNASQVMYESYALAQPADCFSRTGHVAMAVSDPVVVRNEDGTINGRKSYIMIAEQGQYTKAKHHLRTTSDGTSYRIRGNDGKRFYFLDLYKAGFLVYTFPEFVGTDPVEPGKVTIPVTKGKVSVSKLSKGYLESNYPVSDVFTTVYDSNGKEVFRHAERSVDHYSKAFTMNQCLPIEDLKNYDNGQYTIKISSQISNGQLIEVYSGRLVS